MVIGVVRAFEDHRSLADTLQDSEHIARKLGLIVMGVILFILMVRAGAEAVLRLSLIHI